LKFTQNLSSGHLYLPKPIIAELDTGTVWIWATAGVAVMVKKGLAAEHIDRALKVISLHINHDLKLEE
jgi:hypothetical protein